MASSPGPTLPPGENLLPAERYSRKKVLAGRKGRPWGTGHRGQDGSREQHEGKRKTNHTSLYASSRPGRLLMCDLGDEVAGDAAHLVIAAVGRDSCAGRPLARQYTSSRSPNSKASVRSCSSSGVTRPLSARSRSKEASQRS